MFRNVIKQIIVPDYNYSDVRRIKLMRQRDFSSFRNKTGTEEALKGVNNNNNANNTNNANNNNTNNNKTYSVF